MILVLCDETQCSWKFGMIAVSSSPGSNRLIADFLDRLIVKLKAIRPPETSENNYPKHKLFRLDTHCTPQHVISKSQFSFSR